MLRLTIDETLTSTQSLLSAPLQSLVAIVAGAMVLTVLRWMIGRTVRSVVDGTTQVRSHARRLLLRGGVDPGPSDPLAAARRVQRAETMGSVLRSAAALVVGVIVLTVIANIYDWDLAPVLASAGVVGVALGFGAQTLVKDLLSGIFMLVEDQYGVGDVIDVGEVSGTVEAVGLRITQVRDLHGTLWYVRNGEILRVGNKTQGWSRALVEVRIGPDQDPAAALALLREAAEALTADEVVGPLLLDAADVTAFEDLSGESVMLRVMIKTVPAQQWAVQRALRAQIQRAFGSGGVTLALPRREVLVERGPLAAQDQTKSD
ncbi:mechanosensitive ion channel family protein [Actinotalea sp.]|uniref:mechanosensitive ion channel family protein n=1 Tax=Actinotalea sp. TaxID=1872145 RepID=UPI0035664864